MTINKNLNSENLKKNYGKLTIIGTHFFSHRYGGECAKSILCQCECGKKVIKRVWGLKNAKNPACCRKCFHGENLKNKKFGRLTALESKGRENHSSLWKFECECGKIVVLPATNVKSGKTKSCGCLRDEVSRHRFMKINLSDKPRFINCIYCDKKIITMSKTRKFCNERCRGNYKYHQKKRLGEVYSKG